MHTKSPPLGRRSFVWTSASALGAGIAGCAATPKPASSTSAASRSEDREARVTPGEDLMQEHGVLRRVLLVYEECARRVQNNLDLDPQVVQGAARVVRDFVEDYHERLEEEFVFPKLEAAGREVELSKLLRLQHERGRLLTEAILQKTAQGSATPELAELMHAFIRMYRPHAAREDTVLFPALRELLGRGAYSELGEHFERLEHQKLGENGFRDTVYRVAGLERELGIFALDQFTPAPK